MHLKSYKDINRFYILIYYKNNISVFDKTIDWNKG